MSKHPLRYLLTHFQRNTLTRAQHQELFQALQEEQHAEEVKAFLDEQLLAQPVDAGEGDADVDWDALFRRIRPEGTIPARPGRVVSLRKWWWAAASLVLLAGVGIYYYRTTARHHQPVVMAPPVNIAPGRQGAVLTLANGAQVILDSVENGTIAAQQGSQVILQNGQLSYHTDGRPAAETAYNTMTTPRGRQFNIVLPDGTKVWLNAASSLRYPTAFNGRERMVDVTGEAYFEVAKNAGLPFRVNVNRKAVIEVLGTQFNVNAYDNEPVINTTLLSGSVRMESKAGSRPVLLKPGEQAQVANQQPGQVGVPAIKVVDNADMEKTMAWRNGVFNFNHASLEEVMRQLERWYDIKVVYEGEIPSAQYYGEINKQNTLAELLHILEKNDVHFRLEEGNRLVVLH